MNGENDLRAVLIISFWKSRVQETPVGSNQYLSLLCLSDVKTGKHSYIRYQRDAKINGSSGD